MDSIIIDTSSILFALSNKIDIFNAVKDELRMVPIISKGVVNELGMISGSAKANSKYASVALQLIVKYGMKVIPDERYVDSWILSAAKTGDNVCTNDTALRGALKKMGVRVYAISREGHFR